MEWGRAQPGQAFLPGRGQAAPRPASSACSDQIQVPLARLLEPPEPRARLRLLPACGLPCAQCGQTRTLWGAGVPWGSGTCPRACLQGGSPGAGVLPVCSVRPASSCPPPHSPSASRGLASAFHLMRTPGAAWSWGPGAPRLPGGAPMPSLRGAPGVLLSPPPSLLREVEAVCAHRPGRWATWRRPEGGSSSFGVTVADRWGTRPCSPERPAPGRRPACVSTEWSC